MWWDLQRAALMRFIDQKTRHHRGFWVCAYDGRTDQPRPEYEPGHRQRSGLAAGRLPDTPLSQRVGFSDEPLGVRGADGESERIQTGCRGAGSERPLPVPADGCRHGTAFDRVRVFSGGSDHLFHKLHPIGGDRIPGCQGAGKERTDPHRHEGHGILEPLRCGGIGHRKRWAKDSAFTFSLFIPWKTAASSRPRHWSGCGIRNWGTSPPRS